MRILFLYFTLIVTLFASSTKYLELVPANINYKQESIAELSELLYDAVVNAVAEYNFKQLNRDNIFILSDGLMAKQNEKQKIKKFYKEFKEKPAIFLTKHNVDRVVLMDFLSKNAKKKLAQCRKVCTINISLIKYKNSGNQKAKIIPMQYDNSVCLFNDASIEAMNKEIEVFLSN